MHATRNDLPLSARQSMAELLNARLADLIDLQSHAKQAHWNVKGPHFSALHELFDKVAEEVENAVDDVAERAVTLGGVARGTVALVVKTSKLAEYPADITQGADHLKALANSLAAVGKAVRSAIDDAARVSDAGTSDLFTGISRDLDKLLWMVEAHTQAER